MSVYHTMDSMSGYFGWFLTLDRYKLAEYKDKNSKDKSNGVFYKNSGVMNVIPYLLE